MAFFWALVSDWDLKKFSEKNVIRLRPQMDGHELIELQNGAEYCICESTNPKGFTEASDREPPLQNILNILKPLYTILKPVYGADFCGCVRR